MTQAAAGGGERREPYLVAELAREWRVDKSTVYRAISAGRLRAVRHGRRKGIRVPADAAAEYLETATAGAVA